MELQQFSKWLESQTEEEVGRDKSQVAFALHCLLKKYLTETQEQKKTATEKKIYVYHNTITTDPHTMNDIVFNELSKYKNGYPSDKAIQEEWDAHVEEHPYSPEELIEWVRKNYRWEL